MAGRVAPPPGRSLFAPCDGEVELAGYQGDVVPAEAWAMLKSDPEARLIDVRSSAEWSFVGVPDLASVGRKTVLVAWATFPGMVRNPDFVNELERQLAAVGHRRGAPLLFLCRSGARSRAAAIAATEAGLGPAYNVAEGFEGDLDKAQHRASLGGWKRAGLPWAQS